MRRARRSRGVNLAEVVILLVVLVAIALLLLYSIPRRREVARAARCQRNLMQIGVALALYDGATGHLPTIPLPGRGQDDPAANPLDALLVELGQPDLSRMTAPGAKPPRQAEVVAGPKYLTGFFCPSDLIAAAGRASPLSYRATAGDRPDGATGAFAPGRVVRLSDVSAGDGLEFTAAFSERLLGTRKDRLPGARDYALVAGPIGPGRCPDAPPTSWRGDAGSAWEASWKSGIYNHILIPNSSQSCIIIDERAARMGASSGHDRVVYALILDGGVRPFRETVAPEVWRGWATLNGGPAPPP